MKIAVIGATGRIGSRIRDEALSRGHSVAGIARDVAALPARSGLHATACDLADEAALGRAIAGSDAVVVSVDWAKTDMEHVYAACRLAGVKRVLMVGGASSLERTPGVRLCDEPGYPPERRAMTGPAVRGLDRARQLTDLDWTYASPSQVIEPGERTGKFRTAGDSLIVDATGKSRITHEDFAVAIVDELEEPRFVRRRFTAGY